MLENAVIDEIWFFDGDRGHVLGCVEDSPAEWLIERGVLIDETDEHYGLEELIEGDVVYRIRKKSALKRAHDPREPFFSWEKVTIQ